jgi:DNA-binding transcriptional LysR family regulator
MQRRHESLNLPIEALRAFVTILETGSFTKAAAVLGLTQSAISAQVKRLESILGDNLFVKGVAHITLTGRGQTVSEQARRLIAINDQILATDGHGPRLGLPSMYGGGLLRELVSCCHGEGLPDVQFCFDRSENIEKRYDAGHLDVIVQLATHPAPDAVKSWTEQMEWVSAPDFVIPAGAKVPWLSCPGSIGDDVARTAFDRANIGYAIKVVASDLNSVIEGVHAGLGYFVLVARDVPPDLKVCRDTFLPKLSPIHVCVRASREFDGEVIGKLVACIERSARGGPAKIARTPSAPNPTLADSLGILVRTAIEHIGGGARAAFYNADDAGLHHIIGMPKAFAMSVDNFLIGPTSLSCGLAAATQQPVHTHDVLQDPSWKPWLGLAKEFDFRACWSFPITTSDGRVLGTFALYFKEPREATPRDLDIASTIVSTAAIMMLRPLSNNSVPLSDTGT